MPIFYTYEINDFLSGLFAAFGFGVVLILLWGTVVYFVLRRVLRVSEEAEARCVYCGRKDELAFFGEDGESAVCRGCDAERLVEAENASENIRGAVSN